MIITINDVRRYGYCAKGARAFFEQYHLDWLDFLKNGVAAEKLLATRNDLAIALVEKVKEQAHGHG